MNLRVEVPWKASGEDSVPSRDTRPADRLFGLIRNRVADTFQQPEKEFLFPRLGLVVLAPILPIRFLALFHRRQGLRRIDELRFRIFGMVNHSVDVLAAFAVREEVGAGTGGFGAVDLDDVFDASAVVRRHEPNAAFSGDATQQGDFRSLCLPVIHPGSALDFTS